MWVVAVLVLLQDPKQERKEFEKKVSQAVSDFDKAFGQGKKIEAIDLLKGLCHEKAIAALARCLNDAPDVKRHAIAVLSELDHPKSAEALAKAVKPNQSEKDSIGALVKAMDKCRWDIFHAAMADLLVTLPLDQANAQTIGDIAQVADRIGGLVFVEPLISLLKKFDGLPKNDSNKSFHDLLKRALKSSTSEELETGKAYEDWWKNNRGKAEALARAIVWCPVTMKRWDRRLTDTKAYCPHHGDKVVALRDQQIVAQKTLK